MNKVQKIREEVERIQLYTQSEVLKQVLDYIDQVQKEPVSEGLEEAALMHFKDVMEYEVKSGLKMANMTSFKTGAKWQQEKMMAKAVDAKLLEGHLIRQKGVTHPLHVGDKIKVIVIKED